MANERIYQVRALTTNTVGVGGVSSLGVQATGERVLSSTDGAIGVEDFDISIRRILATLGTTDVSKINSILDSTPGSTVFSGKQSGQDSKWSTYTLAGGGILWMGFNFTANRNPGGDATATFNGQVRFSGAAIDLDDVITIDDTIVVEPTAIYPSRLFKPHTASFDPDGADPAITPLHVDSIGMSMAARVLDESSDNDIGTTAVDRADWGPLEVTMGIKDASEVATDRDMATSLLQAARGDLTITLSGRAGAADQTLTINGLKWVDMTQTHNEGYSTYQLTGVASWKNGATTYGLNSGTKLFSIA